MRLAVVTLTLTLVAAASAQTVANPLEALLAARQTSDPSDESACISACEQQLASQKGSALQKCAEKANGDVTAAQKCFCQTGVYDASAGCIGKCFPDGSGDDAEAAIKQQCAELGVSTGSGNGASAPVRASGALALAVVGAVAVAVI